MGGLGEIGLVVLGAAAGGLVNGLTGFGTGVTALPFWLHVLTPIAATQLVAACSVSGQLTTLSAIWREVDWWRSSPMIAAGIAGVPIGAMLGAAMEPATFKRAVGLIVIGYGLSLLCGRRPAKPPHAGDEPARILIPLGLLAGILSGLAGLSGILPTMFALWRGWDKQRSRVFFQAFNLPVLAATLLLHVLINGPASGLAGAFLMALPATIVAALLGQRIYRGLPSRRFQTLVLALLIVSGMTLVAGQGVAPTVSP